MKLRRKKKLQRGRTSPHELHSIAPPNSIGFAALPPELLLEIINYLPRFPVPCRYLDSPIVTPVPSRQATLLALVQLCRSFRRTLIHCLWEEVILCALHGGQTTADFDWMRHSCEFPKDCHSCERSLAYEIVAQLETVTVRVPEYATRVKTLSIFIPKYSAPTIVPEFARCLALLPNLSTLQFHTNIYSMVLDENLQHAFTSYQYPSIRTLVTPCFRGSASLLKACLNVGHLHFTSINGHFHYPYCRPDTFPHVERFTGVCPDLYRHSFQFHYVLPNLKYVQLRTKGIHTVKELAEIREDVEQRLAQLVRLEVIEVAIVHSKAQQEAEILRDSAEALLTRMPHVTMIRRRVEVCDYTADLSG